MSMTPEAEKLIARLRAVTGFEDKLSLVVLSSQAADMIASLSESVVECPSCHGMNTSCPEGCGRDLEMWASLAKADKIIAMGGGR